MKYLKKYEGFKDWIKKNFDSPIDDKKQTQEELDKQLYDAMVERGKKDRNLAFDALKKGANPNQVEDVGRGYEYSLLMIASEGDDMKLIEELIKHGADVYFKAYQWNEENRWDSDKDDIVEDYYDWMNKIVYYEKRPKIKEIILKYHPNFFEERELRKTANKYNL